jgi:ribosomal protein S18 acetylase RimI-like enzyme
MLRVSGPTSQADRPTADVSVRIAWAADAPAVAALQVRAWQERYADLLPAGVLEDLPVDAFTAQWERSIARPKEARQRVLVGLERATVRSFAATAPATDADADPSRDAEITEFIVDATTRGAGHGSRLLHAAVDTLRSDRFTRATLWLVSTDDELREFLVRQGWAADGAFRELDLYGDGTVSVRQVRLHTDVTSEA